MNTKSLLQYFCISDTDNFQQVYTSQVYGTFFTVQAKINTLENVQDHPGVFVKSMDFLVVNYRGVLDIGLVKVEGPSQFSAMVDDANLDYGLKIFHLNMRAMCPEQQCNVPCYEILNLPINQYFEQGDLLYFSRTLKMLHDNGRPLDHGIFDTEFFFREGIDQNGDYQRRIPRPKLDLNNPLEEKNSIPKSKFDIFSGYLCTENLLRTI